MHFQGAQWHDYTTKILSREHDQKKPQSQTVNQPTAP